jgi:hypothetical protein
MGPADPSRQQQIFFACQVSYVSLHLAHVSFIILGVESLRYRSFRSASVARADLRLLHSQQLVYGVLENMQSSLLTRVIGRELLQARDGCQRFFSRVFESYLLLVRGG